MDIEERIRSFRPENQQEAADQRLILRCLAEPDVFTRSNALHHMTASAWVVNPAGTKVLMAYHRIYRAWAWLGGHADGERDLLSVALRETMEESGISGARPVTEEIFSLEVLPVSGHEKRGEYVSSHLHLNATFLLFADESEAVRAKEDENSAVSWFSPEDALAASTEEWMRERIYRKLNRRMRRFF